MVILRFLCCDIVCRKSCRIAKPWGLGTLYFGTSSEVEAETES